MLNNSQPETQSNSEKLVKGQAILNWITRYAGIEIAVFLSLAIAAYFLGRHVLDSSVPGDGDVRAHIFRIQILQSYLSHFSWPQWNPYWYHGIPEDQFYPPGFYFIGVLINLIVRNIAITYKIMLMATLALNGITIFYFAHRFLKFNAHLAIWCLIAFETSTPLLLNFMYGEGPNLLGWSICILFLTIYLSQIMENKTRKIKNIFLAGLILGAAILIHPFPVIFTAIVVAVFHVTWLIHNWQARRIFLHSHLPYILGVVAIGALIGMYYWLPAFLTLNYSSPIYNWTKFAWVGGTLYLLMIIFLALAVTIATRHKIRGDPKLDTLIVSFCLACALGFGATYYLPFGLGSLVQEFRFSTIIIPCLGILLILYPLKYQLIHFKISKLAAALAISAFLSAFIVGLNQREGFVADFHTLTSIDFSSLYHLLSKQFAASFPGFAITIFPYFAVIIFLILSLRPKPTENGRTFPAFIIPAGVCLLILTSFIPYIHTSQQNNMSRLNNFINYYEQPYYDEIMNAAKGGRVIVPTTKGFLAEGDSLVTFGLNWGVETVNGSYNQGDPKFFNMTVHVEWEERWFNYRWTRENLMQENAAKYIFIRGTSSMPKDLSGLITPVRNEYGKLLALNETVSYADKVTPVLVDVTKVREATEFFNILMPEGYKMVLVAAQNVPPDMVSRFNYVMVDSETKASSYKNKTVFILADSTVPTLVEDQGLVRLNIPYLTYTNQLFYHGDPADTYMWAAWDSWAGAQITFNIENTLTKVGKLMSPYLDMMSYSPLDYELNETRIDLGNTPGFTLIKDSYFPYWKSQNNDIVPTTQGFMLLYTDSDNSVINFQKPLYYILATVGTIMGLIAGLATLLILIFWQRSQAGKEQS